MPEVLLHSVLIWTVVFTCVLAGGFACGFPGPLGIASVQVIVPTLFFIALAMGPWAEMIRGASYYAIGLMDWDSVPEALQFATVYVGCLWMGFWWMARQLPTRKLHAPPSDEMTQWLVSARFALVSASFVFVGLQLSDTGLAEIWRSEIPRGFGQFDDWQPSQYFAVLGQLGNLLCIVLSGIVWARRPSRWLLLIPIGESLLWAARLSRGMFLPLLLFVFAAYLCGGRVRPWLFALGPAALGGLGFAILLRGRVETPGLYQMVAESYPGRTGELLDSVVSGSTVVGVLSTAIGLRDEYLSPLAGFMDWLSTLLPIPTFLGWFDRAEVSLAHAMGIAGGTTGLPFPHLGELYYRMGWWGALMGVIVGMWFGYLQRRLKSASIRGWPREGEVVLWYVVSLYGLVLSFHSATRTATRPLLYALLFSVGFRIIRSFIPRRTLSAVTLQTRATLKMPLVEARAWSSRKRGHGSGR